MPLKPLFLALPLVVCAAPALAEDVPRAAQKDLWCGLAFTVVVAEAPSDTAVDPRTLDRLRSGGEMLVGRAGAAHLESGLDEPAFAAIRDRAEAQVRAEMRTPEKDEPYSYEECLELLG